MDWLSLVEKMTFKARKKKIRTEEELRSFIRNGSIFAEIELEENLFDWLALSLNIISVKVIVEYFERCE